MVLTIPRLLRPLFRRRRDLLTELARAAAEAAAELVRRAAATDARPGTVVSIATAGDLLQWHPHLHLLTTDGDLSPDGSFRRVPQWDPTLLMSLFRQRLLARLLDRHAISQELVGKLLAWRQPGFSAHVGEPIEAADRQRLEDTAAYLVRNPLSLRKLVYLDGRQAVLYRSRMNPSLGRNFEALAPLEWLARMSDHISDPGQHRTLFYGEYANRTRGARRRPESGVPERRPETPRRRSSPSWARLIAKVYQVDPLVCSRCGQRMSVIAFLTDHVSIKRLLDQLGLSTPPQDKPPPVRELLRVAEHGEGWGVPADWEQPTLPARREPNQGTPPHAPDRPGASSDRGAPHRRPPPPPSAFRTPSSAPRPVPARLREPAPRGRPQETACRSNLRAQLAALGVRAR